MNGTIRRDRLKTFLHGKRRVYKLYKLYYRQFYNGLDVEKEITFIYTFVYITFSPTLLLYLRDDNLRMRKIVRFELYRLQLASENEIYIYIYTFKINYCT